jgi:eukaryotic-like serine/threonine-protein kinase
VSSDRYDILQKLGDGHFTLGVFLAEHKDLQRTVALKLIEVGPGVHRDDLLQEARAMAALAPHDNVVQVLDAGDWDSDTVYIASEPCTDGSLDSLSSPIGLDPATACRFTSDVCRGLEYMHSEGMLHLDIRPANVLLSAGEPKLCDFGLARWTTNANVPSVYAPHAAPELLATYDGSEASDQYAMAMTLAHVLSGGAICSMPPDPPDPRLWKGWDPLGALDINIPAKLVRVLKRATSYNPTKRYKSVEEFKRAVDGAAPTTSFLPPRNDSVESTDGSWRIEWSSKRGGITVEVLCNGRRKNRMGIKGADDQVFRRHMHGLISEFAAPR